MTLEGAMVCLACLNLTILHPWVYFQGDWRAANFTLRRKWPNSNGKDISLCDIDSEAVEPPRYSECVDDFNSLSSVNLFKKEPKKKWFLHALTGDSCFRRSTWPDMHFNHVLNYQIQLLASKSKSETTNQFDELLQIL